jgi:hypothetical protein
LLVSSWVIEFRSSIGLKSDMLWPISGGTESCLHIATSLIGPNEEVERVQHHWHIYPVSVSVVSIGSLGFVGQQLGD